MFLSNDLLNFISKHFTVILVALIIIFALMLAVLIIKNVSQTNKQNKKMRLLIEGVDRNMKDEKEVEEIKKVVTKKKRFASIRNLYKEYIYFGGTKLSFIQKMVYGYLLFFIIYLVISFEVIPSLILALLYFVVFYLWIDMKNTKNRKKYMKAFSMSLRVICSSLEAGNTFPVAIKNIISKNTIMERLKHEFILLDNNLRTNMSLDDAMDLFYQRNNMFQEFSMFVTIVQFSTKKGEVGLKNVLLGLQETMEKKIENYSEIDSEIGMYQTIFYIIILAEVLVTFLMKLFKPEFFITMSTGMGPLKLIGSVVLAFAGVLFFKNMIRNAAEA